MLVRQSPVIPNLYI